MAAGSRPGRPASALPTHRWRPQSAQAASYPGVRQRPSSATQLSPRSSAQQQQANLKRFTVNSSNKQPLAFWQTSGYISPRLHELAVQRARFASERGPPVAAPALAAGSYDAFFQQQLQLRQDLLLQEPRELSAEQMLELTLLAPPPVHAPAPSMPTPFAASMAAAYDVPATASGSKPTKPPSRSSDQPSLSSGGLNRLQATIDTTPLRRSADAPHLASSAAEPMRGPLATSQRAPCQPAAQ